MDEWTVTATENGYVLSTNLHECVCLVGKAGLIAANGKREGDMATPVGNWPLRRVYFRPDWMSPPQTLLPLVPIHENLGWCDDPANPAYNQAVQLPFADSHETMWRDDSLYDIVVELGYNDAPPVADWEAPYSCIFASPIHSTQPAVSRSRVTICWPCSQKPARQLCFASKADSRENQSGSIRQNQSQKGPERSAAGAAWLYRGILR